MKHQSPDTDGTQVRQAPPVLDRRTALLGAGRLAAFATLPLAAAGSAREAEDEADMKSAFRLVDGRPLTAILAEYAAGTSFDKLPPEVREKAKKVIFDEMACGFFGRRSPGGKLAADYAIRVGGAPEARIYGTDRRVSAAYAAMANGTAGHGDEVDGTHVVGGHPGASIVHTCTAIGARERVSGAELINAVVLGYDVGVRIVEACGGKFIVRDSKHLTSDFFYSLGTTAAAARILKLDPARHCHALALVTFQANGLYALYSEKRHISKSFCNGQYAFAGISSADMAQIGLEGNEDIVGSSEGVLDAWGDGKHDIAVTQKLGTDYKIMGGNFKFYNAGYPIHTPIEAALTLVKENRISAEDIDAVLIGMPENAMKVVDNREMHNICVQDMVAANLARGGLRLVDYPFPEILSDPTYRRLRAAITVSVDPELQREFPNGRGARVTIVTKNGVRKALRIDNPLGHSLRGEPSWDDLGRKWRGSLADCDTDRALSIARKLDSLDDASTLFEAFAGRNI
ncbi:MmgE/PrpD family protein [Sphingobium sp.]|uniref:MmgE/PrpD family protein n=1 Tax=Sphingobium sp. TaxID=1912891 RepID=UPI002CDB04E7|nr:MmgE/PrpD family protein [Sphingobium sp.]HUD94175.1 MmgE/PrpD family protein [Sphingobium sp.]